MSDPLVLFENLFTWEVIGQSHGPFAVLGNLAEDVAPMYACVTHPCLGPGLQNHPLL